MPPQNNKIILFPPAESDILSIARYHASFIGPESARKITDAIFTSIRNLADFPLLGPVHPDPVLKEMGFRYLVIGKYLCVYRFFGDQICIYRVVHGSTDYPHLFY